MWRTLLAVSVGVVLSLALVTPADAAPDTGFPDTFSLRVSGFLVRDQETEFRLDSTTRALGTTIDANRILGMAGDDDVVRLDGYLRLAERHRVDFGWYGVRFEGSRTVDQDIEVGDRVFAAGQTVNSLLRVNTYKLGYSYSFYRNEKVELGLGLGAQVQDVTIRLSQAGGPETETRRVTAPLPVFGFRLDYAITRRLTAHGTVQLFLIEYEKYSGRLTDVEVDLEYRLFRNLAIGVGYNAYQLDLGAEGKRFRGEIDYRFNGVLLYGTLYL